MTDYLIAPVPDNEEQRLTALRAAMCAYAPHEERFDRITRMAQRLMHVPMALISIVEDDVQWFRSAQGLEISETARSISFCGHAIMVNEAFRVPDTRLDARFANNPLVIGPPFVRSYLGWPLEISPGLRVGTLCVLDTMPRSFSREDLEIMHDLGSMAEAELRADSMADNQKKLLAESSRDARKLLLDPDTGSWSETGFIELMRRTMRDVVKGNAFSAMVGIRIHNLEDFNFGTDDAALHARAMVVSQFIRQRLPTNAVLCRIPGGRVAILFAARDKSLLKEQIATFMQEPGTRAVAGVEFSQKLEISNVVTPLSTRDNPELAARIFDGTMDSLNNPDSAISVLH